jgi:LCP family protein required for cell wall assembly
MRWSNPSVNSLAVRAGAVRHWSSASFFSTNSGKISLHNTPSALDSAKDITRAFIQSDATVLRGEKEGRINILLLGRAGTSHSGKDLTDTIALLSIDTINHRAGLLSIPRDLYAPLPGTNVFTKINSIYQYGLRENGDSKSIEKTVSFITGVPIHYTIIVDFDGFEKIVDALGGVTIDNARDIRDIHYPGKKLFLRDIRAQSRLAHPRRKNRAQICEGAA